MKSTPTLNMVAKTQQGLEPLLAKELEQLGATQIEQHKRAVSFIGDKALLYKANLCLRTALRILVPIHKFEAVNEQELYNGIQQLNWEDYMDVNGTLAIEASANSHLFNHTQYLAQKTKDAIVDQFRAKHGVRPSVDLVRPDLRLNLHIFQHQCTLSLDSSGESLHRRGYRAEGNMAPLNEVTAAALILHSGWNGKGVFMDPMCGSGTILIEAAMFAKNIPPNHMREWFAFEGWRDFEPQLWKQVKQEAMEAIVPCEATLIGNDAVFKVIEIARSNARKAGVENELQLSNMRFEEQTPPEPLNGGTLIMNPPYGERIDIGEAAAFYKMLGDVLKQKFSGYDAWILSSNKEALKKVGLAASKRIVVWNSQLECKFHKFEMYRGSKKEQATAEV
ncbi:MAG: THUMP domain-containing protein [Bacteroidia bacterium]|jgi:putative N6-adenine-specific DNA methylase|nr:THUMP domain-containing protein [Bacteroidia bacterium]